MLSRGFLLSSRLPCNRRCSNLPRYYKGCRCSCLSAWQSKLLNFPLSLNKQSGMGCDWQMPIVSEKITLGNLSYLHDQSLSLQCYFPVERKLKLIGTFDERKRIFAGILRNFVILVLKFFSPIVLTFRFSSVICRH